MSNLAESDPDRVWAVVASWDEWDNILADLYKTVLTIRRVPDGFCDCDDKEHALEFADELESHAEKLRNRLRSAGCPI